MKRTGSKPAKRIDVTKIKRFYRIRRVHGMGSGGYLQTVRVVGRTEHSLILEHPIGSRGGSGYSNRIGIRWLQAMIDQHVVSPRGLYLSEQSAYGQLLTRFFGEALWHTTQATLARMRASRVRSRMGFSKARRTKN